ncbi:hypothetical protein [Dactylosporangium sp. CA-233914]|uniref:hypothetical protein n=1 Tax=Dactylosporangium sp. CA-233914 TaxID=3239934 RepID=UPI003D8EB09E
MLAQIDELVPERGASYRRAGGYTWMWLGSSDVICALLGDRLKGAGAAHPDWPLVWADPLTRRAGPHLSDADQGKIPRVGGDAVTGLSGQPDPDWVRMRDGYYVSRAWLTARNREAVRDYDDCEAQTA